MQQCRTYTCRAQAHLLRCYDGDREGVYHVVLANGGLGTFVGMESKVVCFLCYVHFLAMGRIKVPFYQGFI